MKLEQNIKNEIAEIVQMSFESGHDVFDRLEMSYLLTSTYPEKSDKELLAMLKLCVEYYNELKELGPVGFYEEFKDTLKFDPDFVAEYGHYYDEDDEDEEEEE